jgi:hypothetical protein
LADFAAARRHVVPLLPHVRDLTISFLDKAAAQTIKLVVSIECEDSIACLDNSSLDSEKSF